MTIHERLDRLKERQDAMIRTLQSMVAERRNLSCDRDAQAVAAPRDGESIRKLTQKIETMRADHLSATRDIEVLKTAARQDGEKIHELLQMAGRRLSHLEGQQ
jgi:hypothetical protein